MNDAEKLELPHVIEGDQKWNEVRGRGGYFDRSGNAISFRDWMRLTAWDNEKNSLRYKIVKQEHIGPYFVSTVWLGLDHGFGGQPLIFETMVFNEEAEENDRWSDLDMRRYSTEEEALQGHEEIAMKVRLIIEATEGISE